MSARRQARPCRRAPRGRAPWTGWRWPAALEAPREPHRADFIALLEASDGLPTTVRLLDPPLHEFLPDRADLMVKVARADEREEVDEGELRLLAAGNRLHESNPMLGLPGLRLGLALAGLFAVQIRALAEATAQRLKAGGDPRPEVVVPLVGSVMELHLVPDEAVAPLAEVSAAEGVELDIPIGTMVELPRSALTAHRIAEVADFVSFGTNDLTQTTWGSSSRRRRGELLRRLPRQRRVALLRGGVALDRLRSPAAAAGCLHMCGTPVAFVPLWHHELSCRVGTSDPAVVGALR